MVEAGTRIKDLSPHLQFYHPLFLQPHLVTGSPHYEALFSVVLVRGITSRPFEHLIQVRFPFILLYLHSFANSSTNL